MKTVKVVLAVLILSMLMVAACAEQEAKPPPDQVTVQLKWVHQAQFAGLYVAREKGYYAEENLEVTLLEGGPGINNIDRFISQKADFLVDSPESTLTYAGSNRPVAIAAIYRLNPLVFFALPESGIAKPTDFRGKSIGIIGGGLDSQVQLKAILDKVNIDYNEVTIVPYDYDFSGFLSREVDITYAYITGGVMRLRRQGHQLNLIWPSDYGIHFYSDTLFTTEQLIDDNPDLVIRFLRATLRGWQEVVGDPETALEATMQYALEADPELQAAMIAAQQPLVHTGEDQIGWMKPAVWEEIYQLLLEMELAPAALDLNQTYTLEFLEQVYGGREE